MLSRLVSCFVCLVLIGAAVSSQAVASIDLSPPAGTIPLDRVVTLTLRADFTAEPTLGGVIDLNWNPAQLQLIAWRPVPIGDPRFSQPGFPSPGQLQGIGFTDPGGIGGAFELGTISFRAVNVGPVNINVQPNPVGPFLSLETGQPQPVTFAGAAISIGPALNANDADTAWRHVAIVDNTVACPTDPASGCPQTPSWTSQRLFQAAPGGNQPPALAPFCVYELPAPPNGAQINELDALATAGCVHAIGADSMAVTYMGEAQIEPLLWPALRDDFLAQAGQPDATIGSGGVRLAIVDTQPDALAVAGNSPHGFALRSMADELLCADGPCAIDITTTLGLPMLRCDSDPRAYCQDDALGGYMSTIAQLAVAIRAATVAWQTSAPTSRLVINLSVGWHPRYGDDPGDGPQIEAVLRALEDAVCRGALVIAAAGNSINEPSVFPPADPLLPGAWESLPAPGAAACSSALEITPEPSDFPPGPGVYRPLLHATGAVGAGNEPVATRWLGEPRLVAFGDHAVSAADEGTGPTQIQTGTSVSSLVIAAAAAAAWAQAPDAPAYVVTEVVYDSGVALDRPAEFFDATCDGCDTQVRRVRVCEVAAAACTFFGNEPCTLTCAANALPGPPPLPIDTLTALFVPTAGVDVSDLDQLLVPDIETCGDYNVRYRVDDFPASPCPQFERWGIQAVPYASGQPSSQPCEVCANVNSIGDLFIEIDDDFAGGLSDMTVACDGSAFRLPTPADFGAGDSYLVTGLPPSCGEAKLAYNVTEPGDTMPTSSVSTLPLKHFDDADRDGLADDDDNCLAAANADQRDSDGDGIGNACDADIAPAANDCIVNAQDLGALRLTFFLSTGDEGFNADADFNGDGVVNVIDLGVLRAAFFSAPGPSGIAGNLCE